MRCDALTAAALAAGAYKAVVIPRDGIVTDRAFRAVCEGNACGKYDTCYMCPPAIGDIDTLIARLDRYTHGLLYQSVATLEDSFDIEGMGEGARRHAQLSQAVQDAVAPLLAGDSLHLSCGGCNLCERCGKWDGIPCRFPDRALPPMEGYGIDVYHTTAPTPLKYINGQDTVTFFGLVLFSEVNDG